MMDESLIAPCGMNCRLCISYQAGQKDINKLGFHRKYCPGCLPRGKHCTHMGDHCARLRHGTVRFCIDCPDYPCARLKSLDRRYRVQYNMSMLDNLEIIRSKGLTGLLEQEEAKWRCPRCGRTLCCHNGLCLDCDLEALRMNKKHRAKPLSINEKPVVSTSESLDRYAQDRAKILAHRQDNGGDHWATPDLKLAKGGPFSTLESAMLLVELGLPLTDPTLQAVAGLFFDCQREDGRFRLAPGAIYPCQTIQAFLVLCRLGHATDPRLAKTLQHLLDIQYHDGGWRCNKFSFGRGPETESSNPGPTLTALNAFRHTSLCNHSPALDRAVEFLLAHWTLRQPIGPCHYGIGTLFMQVEYPFMTYNLFQYVYVLSFYKQAHHDERFLDALRTLESKLVNGQIVVERVNSKLASLDFCRKGQPSELGTTRYQEILRNLMPATE